MALSRRTGHRFQASIWPGFVDAMTGLLLVLMFVLTIFMVVQFVLRETITGQENELNLLSAEIAAIAEALGLEQEKVSALKGEVGALTSTLSDTQTELMAQANLIDQLTFQRDSTQQQLVSAQAKITSFEAQVAGLLKSQSEKTAQIVDLEGEKSLLMSQQEALNLALATARSEIDKSVEEARRKAAERDALEALIASLKTENSDQKSFLNQQSADLQSLQQRLSAEEEARLLEAAAAQALRKKLENADAELTAMSLALEEQRRAAEETLTMLAAAEAAQELVAARLQDSVLALNAAQLQLADRDQDIQRLQSKVTDSAAELDQTEVALAAALARQVLLEDQIAALQRQRAQLEIQERTLSQTQAQQADAIKRLQTALSNSEKSRTESQDNQSSALELAKALQAQLSAALAAVAQAEDARALLQAKVDETTKQLDATTSQAANQAAAQAAQIAQAETAKASLEENLAAALAAKLAAETDMNKVAAQLKAALAAKLAADQDLAAQLDAREQQKILLQQAQQTLLDTSQELQQSDAQLLKAERQAAALNQQVTALRQQLAKVSDLLEISEEKDIESQAQLQNLGNRLNAALARAASEQRRRLKLEEAESQRLEAEKLKLEAERDLLASQAEDLAKYKSEFFGSLRILLADQVGVRIVGDRFVFSSEVLFAPGAAELSQLGQSEIVKVGSILNKIMSEIPQNIDWIIRVDGHTDDQPLSGTGEFKDNWELSQARALSVVKFMISQLNIPADRLAANGFAEFQPVNTANTAQARSQNRRIELKLTER
ncbi:MAG: peptidoglycan -binding protein [Rhodobacteraceae bacterium]|nr:peptidoglycan -binding protein [Paracoccaceae bacterium]MBL6788173.1 peptidoglycan -binding protein [Paracoccaceae bacterium]MBL6858724.1 peptidoglycan -binding protein [Paracoccaceae bacterium]